MRALFWIVTLFALLYGGYWFVGSRTVLSGTRAALEDYRAAGVADFEDVSIAGFPSRFDLTVTGPRWQSLDGQMAWSSDWLGAYSLSYRPNHVIAVLPDEQRMRVGPQTLTIGSEDLRASAVFDVATRLPLVRAQMVGKMVELRSDLGWGLAADEVRLAIREKAEPNAYEVGAVVLSPELRGTLTSAFGGALPARGTILSLDAGIVLDKPLDRDAPRERVRILEADIRTLDLDWGGVRLQGQGRVTIGMTGLPDGRVDLTVSNWRSAVDAAVTLDLVQPDVARTLDRALTLLALANGNGDSLSLPLVFQNGLMSLGPVPLGAAPRF